MTKFTRFAALSALACGVVASSSAFGAPRPETTTYVDGNVSSLKPNTGGTLVFTDETKMMFRTGLAEVAVPYANILRAELGATQEHSHDGAFPGPLKVLGRLHKTETQLLILEFKNGLGETRTMTLELSKPAASSVLSTIEARTTKPAEKTAVASAKTETKDPAKDAWWGDSFWKTNRNQDTFGK